MESPSIPTSQTNIEAESNAVESTEEVPKLLNTSSGAIKLWSWLNKSFRVEMVDGRVLIGIFLCTDRDANVILGSCVEHLPVEESVNNSSAAEEPRMLGLVMIPGKHIVSVCLDQINSDINISDVT